VVRPRFEITAILFVSTENIDRIFGSMALDFYLTDQRHIELGRNMFCTNCGTARDNGSNFCAQCGKPFAIPVDHAVEQTHLAAMHAPQQSNGATVALAAVPPKIGDGFYWALATSPIALLFGNAILSGLVGGDAGTFLGSFLSLIYVLFALSIDASRIRKAGLRVPMWIGVLLTPLYLFKRAKATGRNQGAFVIWLVGYAVSFVVAVASISNLGSTLVSESYKSGQNAGSQAAQDRFNSLFGSIEDSCAAKSDYFSWTNYDEFIQGCVDEYNAETGN
jgi:uncharacterized membrane protein YhaH (DUF805 family)